MLNQWLVTHANLDSTKFVLHTDASVNASMLKLQEACGKVAPAHWDELQIVHGFTFHANSILLSKRLNINVASSVMWDWMHCYCEGGLVDNEIGLCMCALKAANAPTTYATVGAYIKLFKLPKHLPRVDQMFTDRNCSKFLEHKKISGTATQVLSLCPLIAMYFMMIGLKQTCAWTTSYAYSRSWMSWIYS